MKRRDLLFTGLATLPASRAGARRPYLDAAMKAAKWLAANADPGEKETNVYSGSAGVVLFYVEAHRLTGGFGE